MSPFFRHVVRLVLIAIGAVLRTLASEMRHSPR
jgi:hypothetical protein